MRVRSCEFVRMCMFASVHVYTCLYMRINVCVYLCIHVNAFENILILGLLQRKNNPVQYTPTHLYRNTSQLIFRFKSSAVALPLFLQPFFRIKQHRLSQVH